MRKHLVLFLYGDRAEARLLMSKPLYFLYSTECYRFDFGKDHSHRQLNPTPSLILGKACYPCERSILAGGLKPESFALPRAHSDSDRPPDYHSIHSCRFATSMHDIAFVFAFYRWDDSLVQTLFLSIGFCFYLTGLPLLNHLDFACFLLYK